MVQLAISKLNSLLFKSRGFFAQLLHDSKRNLALVEHMQQPCSLDCLNGRMEYRFPRRGSLLAFSSFSFFFQWSALKSTHLVQDNFLENLQLCTNSKLCISDPKSVVRTGPVYPKVKPMESESRIFDHKRADKSTSVKSLAQSIPTVL